MEKRNFNFIWVNTIDFNQDELLNSFINGNHNPIAAIKLERYFSSYEWVNDANAIIITELFMASMKDKFVINLEAVGAIT